MVDRVSAKIKIGGRLESGLLDELATIVLDECVGPDWGDTFRNKAEVLEWLGRGVGGVTFYGEEVAYGEFPKLQAFCVEHTLHYVLSFDGSRSGGPGRRIRRPGDEGEGVYRPLDEDGGYACISGSQITANGFTSIEEVLRDLERFDLSETPDLVIVEAARGATPGQGAS